MPTVYLIDASPYIFRAYYSIPTTMTTPDGSPSNAVYGYTEFLLQVLKQAGPTHLAVAFDGSLTTSFRNEIYPAYKAQRALPPPKLKAQIGLCRQVTKALGMKSYIDDRFESDDIIGTLVLELLEQGSECVIVSSDKDFTQLVNGRVTMWNFARDERYDADAVCEKFGVRPAQIVDLLALMGDSVDNIPGVPGVGPKSACALLNHFGNLSEIYRNLAAVEKLPIRGAQALQAKLAAARDSAEMSRKLAAIALDVPLSAELESLRYAGACKEEVDTLFAALGFERIQERIPVWHDEFSQ